MSETKTYRVTAPSSVYGVEPGEEFTRAIPADKEARLLGSGAIEEVSGRPADSDPEPEVEESKPFSTYFSSSNYDEEKE